MTVLGAKLKKTLASSKILDLLRIFSNNQQQQQQAQKRLQNKFRRIVRISSNNKLHSRIESDL